jgi:SNF2 family DNA or RNA helicase
MIKTPLLKHQQEGLERVADRPYHAILYQPGLGKTLTVLSIIDARRKKYPAYRVLYVCPNTLIENVMEETALRTDLTCVPLRGSRSKRVRLLEAYADIYLINYEATRIVTEELISKRFQLVVFDESHSLKNHTAQQSKACFRIAMSCPHRIIMTGTMIHNTPLDAFGQYRCLSPDIFGHSYYQFRARYAIMGGYLGKQIVKYINMDRFKARVLEHSIIRTKEECLDLPPRLYETVRTDLTDLQKKMYQELREQFITFCEGSIVTAPVILTRLMRFSQITAGFYKDVE